MVSMLQDCWNLTAVPKLYLSLRCSGPLYLLTGPPTSPLQVLSSPAAVSGSLRVGHTVSGQS